MPTTMVRYKTKPNRTKENQGLIESVFEELSETSPPGLSYASFKLSDGVSFMHIARVADAKDNPLSRSPAFQQFVENIDDRCEEEPAATELTEIGSFKFFAR